MRYYLHYVVLSVLHPCSFEFFVLRVNHEFESENTPNLDLEVPVSYCTENTAKGLCIIAICGGHITTRLLLTQSRHSCFTGFPSFLSLMLSHVFLNSASALTDL